MVLFFLGNLPLHPRRSCQLNVVAPAAGTFLAFDLDDGVWPNRCSPAVCWHRSVARCWRILIQIAKRMLAKSGSRRLSFPDLRHRTSWDLTLRAFEPGPLNLKNGASFSILVDTGSDPFTNKRDRLDVDADSAVTALDALRVINFIDDRKEPNDQALGEYLRESSLFSTTDSCRNGGMIPDDYHGWKPA